LSSIITADIHLNEKQQDEYRWKLFDWLLTKSADELIICGDLTDAKDKHSAQLVNKLNYYLELLNIKFKVIILKGNHDWLTDPAVPFFKFLNNLPNVEFVIEPAIIDLSIGKATFVPAGVKWDFKLHNFPYVFAHATFSGAVAENGTKLTGVNSLVLDDYKGICYSGDVHVPQILAGGKIVYIGAPYHTRFGDSFDPRILYVDDKGKASDWYFPAPMKRTFLITKPEDLNDESASSGDHVKVRCYLKRSEYVNWKSYKEEIRNIAEERKWKLFGIESVPLDLVKEERNLGETQVHKSSQHLVTDYVKRQKASEDHLTLGLELLE
jgi:UDP-2,3-diacylglucosamine pyrophosphatase LpxH